MSLNRLRRHFEERRLSLIETLQKGKKGMDLSKQHQVYGAIKEIESFLKTIDYYHQEELKGADFELKREGPKALSTRAGDAVKRMGKGTKRVFTGMGGALHTGFVKPAAGAVKGTKERIRLYKEVSKEVKARKRKKHPKPRAMSMTSGRYTKIRDPRRPWPRRTRVVRTKTSFDSKRRQ